VQHKGLDGCSRSRNVRLSLMSTPLLEALLIRCFIGGALYSPVACGVHDRGKASPCTRYSAFLAQASQPLWLAGCNDV